MVRLETPVREDDRSFYEIYPKSEPGQDGTGDLWPGTEDADFWKLPFFAVFVH